jgi:hypothetical protein
MALSTIMQHMILLFHVACQERVPEKPKGIHRDTFDRLELKDLEAHREKMLLLSSEISLGSRVRELSVDPQDDVLGDDSDG